MSAVLFSVLGQVNLILMGLVALLVVVWRSRNRRHAGVLVALVAIFVAGQRFLPHAEDRELAWAWWQHER